MSQGAGLSQRGGVRRAAVAEAERPDDSTARLFARGTIDVRGAVKEFNICRSLLYRMMQDGRLNFTRAGRKRLLPRQELIDHLAAGLARDANG